MSDEPAMTMKCGANQYIGQSCVQGCLCPGIWLQHYQVTAFPPTKEATLAHAEHQSNSSQNWRMSEKE